MVRFCTRPDTDSDHNMDKEKNPSEEAATTHHGLVQIIFISSSEYRMCILVF